MAERTEKQRQDDVAEKRLKTWLHYNKPERPIHVIPGRHLKYGEKWGVDKLPEDQRQPRKVLFTGTGRSGTHNIAKLLQHVKIDVGHERVGKIGTSSNFFIVDSDWYPFAPSDVFGQGHIGERQSDYLFENVIHVVRHPLLVIPSVEAKFGELNYEFMEDNHVFPKFLREYGVRTKGWKGMMIYYWVNKYIEDHFPNAVRVKLEDLKSWWSMAVEKCGYPASVPLPSLPPSNKSRVLYWKPVPVAQMYKIDRVLTESITEMAHRYGYEMDDTVWKRHQEANFMLGGKNG